MTEDLEDLELEDMKALGLRIENASKGLSIRRKTTSLNRRNGR